MSSYFGEIEVSEWQKERSGRAVAIAQFMRLEAGQTWERLNVTLAEIDLDLLDECKAAFGAG